MGLQSHHTAPAAGARLRAPGPSPAGPPALPSRPRCRSPPIIRRKGENHLQTARQPLHLPEARVPSPIELLGGVIEKLLLNNFRFVLGRECSSFSTCLTRGAGTAAGESGCQSPIPKQRNATRHSTREVYGMARPSQCLESLPPCKQQQQ